MKNALYTALFILVAGNLSYLGLPWWSIAPVGAIAAFLFPIGIGASWLTGFLAGALLWFANAYVPDHANAGMLSDKIGQLFMGISSMKILLITAVLGGLLGALGVVTGHYARVVFVRPKPKRTYR
jgi:hypothetical protein